MPQNSQKGFAHLILIGLILLGIGITVYLVQTRTNFLPHASEVAVASCKPRPACLDAKRACKIAITSDMCPPTSNKIKIMPLGDSITLGTDTLDSSQWAQLGGYRTYLYNKLVQNGYQIDFVGSLSTGPSSLADKDHEGHPAYTIASLPGYPSANITDNIDNWLTKSPPDIILLQIGTNDIYIGIDLANAPTRLSNLIDKITTQMPNAILFVAAPTLIVKTGIASRQPSFNNAIPAIVSQKKAEGKKVEFVDMYPVVSANELIDATTTGAHPTEVGYQKMADKWYEALKPFLDITPSPSSSGSSLISGLVGYWNLDQLGNELTSSLSGGNASATGTTSVAGKINQSRSFTSGSNRVQTQPINLNLTDMSVGAWIYPTGVNASAVESIINQWNSSQLSWALGVVGNNQIAFHPANCSYDEGWVISNNPISLNNWHFVAATRQGNSGVITLYVDGIVAASSIGAPLRGGPVCNQALPITIGAYNASNDFSFKGLIDEVGIWNRVLSSEEISSLYNNSQGQSF